MGGEVVRIKEKKKHGLRKAAFLVMFSNVSGYVCMCVLKRETIKGHGIGHMSKMY